MPNFVISSPPPSLPRWSGELLLTAFHQHKRDGNKVMEQTLLFRSPDVRWKLP